MLNVTNLIGFGSFDELVAAGFILNTVSIISSSQGNGSTDLNYPATQAGDVLIYTNHSDTANFIPTTSGPGWFRVNGAFSSSSAYLQTYAKVCDGTETGLIQAGDSQEYTTLFQIRGDQPITAIDIPSVIRYQSTNAIADATLLQAAADYSETAGVILVSWGASGTLSGDTLNVTADDSEATTRCRTDVILMDKGDTFPTLDADVSDNGTNSITLTALRFFTNTTQATTLTLHDSEIQTSGTTNTVTLPSCQEGDLLVVVQKITGTGAVDSYNSLNSQYPFVNGFRCFGVQNLGDDIVGIFVKIAESTDNAGTVTLRTDTTTSVHEYIALAMRADAPIRCVTKASGDYHNTSFSATNIDSEMLAGNPAANSFFSVRAGDAAQVAAFTIAAWSSTGAVNPRTWTSTNAEDTEVNTDTSFYVKYRWMNTGATTVTIDMDDEGASNWLAGVNLCLQVEA